jgi:hypothetical protein
MTCSRVSLFDYDIGRLLQLVSRNRGIVGQKTLKGDGCLTHIAGHELPPHRRAEIVCFQQRISLGLIPSAANYSVPFG